MGYNGNLMCSYNEEDYPEIFSDDYEEDEYQMSGYDYDDYLEDKWDAERKESKLVI